MKEKRVATIGRDGRVDECGGLESRCTVYGTGGSNPSLSDPIAGMTRDV